MAAGLLLFGRSGLVTIDQERFKRTFKRTLNVARSTGKFGAQRKIGPCASNCYALLPSGNLIANWRLNSSGVITWVVRSLRSPTGIV